MGVSTVMFVSDTHLSADSPEAESNWAAVAVHAAATRPDLVVHLGDLTLDGANRSSDLHHARHLLARLPVPCAVVPGNHDVGDNRSARAGDRPDADAITDARRQDWLDIVGPDHWLVELDGWYLVGVDAELFGTGLAAELEQWHWLEDQVVPRVRSVPFALASHKPLAAPAEELAGAPPYRFVPREAHLRLMTIFGDRPPRVVVSGHVHQHRVLQIGPSLHVWAPSTWAVLPDEAQPEIGSKRCGVLTARFDGDDAAVRISMVEPPHLAQLTLTRDLADPYVH